MMLQILAPARLDQWRHRRIVRRQRQLMGVPPNAPLPSTASPIAANAASIVSIRMNQECTFVASDLSYRGVPISCS